MKHVPFLNLGASTRELRTELDAAARRVLDSGWFVLGPEVERFEAEFAVYCGVAHCVGVGNGLDALRLILEASGIGAGDEVIVPAQTFIATWLAVSAVGATPVAIDVEPGTCNIDPAAIGPAISPRTRAVVGVHLFGRPVEIDAIQSVVERHHLLFVEDAAQAHGAVYRGRRAGALAHAAAFSFYPAKNLGAFGDAGAVTTSDGELAARLRKLRNYGSTVKYVHETIGVNSRLDELQAALLRVKLARLDAWNDRRRALVERYRTALEPLEALVMPASDGPEMRSAWHLFACRTPRRESLRAWLQGDGIDTLVHYPETPGRSLAYSATGLRPGEHPNAESWAREELSLPLHPHLEPESQDAVVESIFRWAAQAS